MATSVTRMTHSRSWLRWLHPRQAIRRLEILAWSGLVRLLLATQPIDRTIAILDALPHRSGGHARPLPPERPFRFAGMCLGRSIARSQHLRVRGCPSTLVIGVRGGISSFAAHAWLDGDAVEPDYIELRRVRR